MNEKDEDRYLDTIHTHLDLLRKVEHDLKLLADAFHYTGSETLAERLKGLSFTVHGAHQNIGQAVSMELNKRAYDE